MAANLGHAPPPEQESIERLSDKARRREGARSKERMTSMTEHKNY
jgi:hypothetical protein